jgi:hypothetical protein
VSRCRWSAVKRPRRGRRLLHSFPLRLHPGPWHLLRKRRLPRSESSGAAEALRLYYSTHRCTNASAPAASRLRPTATAALLNTGGFRKPPFARCSDEVPEVRRRRGQGRCDSWEAVHVAKGRGRRPLTPTVVIGSESSRGQPRAVTAGPAPVCARSVVPGTGTAGGWGAARGVGFRLSSSRSGTAAGAGVQPKIETWRLRAAVPPYPACFRAQISLKAPRAPRAAPLAWGRRAV